MNIFLITCGVLLLLISPGIYFIYKLAKLDKTAPIDDVARIRYLQEMQAIEGMKK